MTTLDLLLALVGVVVAGLAGFHLSRTFTTESLLEGSRGRVEAWAYDDLGQPVTFWRGKVGDLLTCGFCLGFWLTVLAWWAWAYAVDLDLRVTGHVVLVFAAAGVQGRLHYASNRDVQQAVLADAQRRRLEGA